MSHSTQYRSFRRRAHSTLTALKKPQQNCHTFAFRSCDHEALWNTSTNLKKAFRFHSTGYVCMYGTDKFNCTSPFQCQKYLTITHVRCTVQYLPWIYQHDSQTADLCPQNNGTNRKGRPLQICLLVLEICGVNRSNILNIWRIQALPRDIRIILRDM